MAQCRLISEVLNIGRIPSRVLSLRAESRRNPSQAIGGRHQSCDTPVCYIVPGNPGNASFYSCYMEHLWRISEGRMDILCVGHAGQDPGVLKCDLEADKMADMSEEAAASEDSLDCDDVYFTVADQVRHHSTALHQLTEASQPVIIMCHSMGSYLTLKMCHDAEIRRRIVKILHLFPCPAGMGRSPNGRIQGPFLTKFQAGIRLLHWAITFLPHCLVRAAVRLQLRDTAADFRQECVEIVMTSLVGERCLEAVACTVALGGHEVHVIKEFDFNMLRLLQDRSTFICSPADGWFPLERVEELRQELPESDIRMVDIPHAFVLHKSAEVAAMAWDLIQHFAK